MGLHRMEQKNVRVTDKILIFLVFVKCSRLTRHDNAHHDDLVFISIKQGFEPDPGRVIVLYVIGRSTTASKFPRFSHGTHVWTSHHYLSQIFVRETYLMVIAIILTKGRPNWRLYLGICPNIRQPGKLQVLTRQQYARSIICRQSWSTCPHPSLHSPPWQSDQADWTDF